jgi:L-alanine-DL-glutamate epimerase-like enolase superfamily enzyme
MKVIDLRSWMYKYPYPTPIVNGKYVYKENKFVILELHTDEGITGIGWVSGSEVVKTTLDQMRSLIIGMDPLRPEHVWEKLYQPKVFGRKGHTIRALSGVDIALWDIMGKVAGLPLYRLLGGYRNKIEAYLAGGYYEEGKGLDELAKEMAGYVEMGAKSVKMKVGVTSIKEDVERVRVVREAIGDDINLLIDANNAYTPATAIQLARKIEKYDIFWFEEPIASDNLEGLAAIKDKTSIPIASGENEFTRWGCKDLVQYGKIDYLNADAAIMGGITEWRKVAGYCAAFDLPVVPHGHQELQVHLVCSQPNGLMIEYYRSNVKPLLQVMFKEPLPYKDGYVEAPEKPGLGLEIDYQAVERYKV